MDNAELENDRANSRAGKTTVLPNFQPCYFAPSFCSLALFIIYLLLLFIMKFVLKVQYKK